MRSFLKAREKLQRPSALPTVPTLGHAHRVMTDYWATHSEPWDFKTSTLMLRVGINYECRRLSVTRRRQSNMEEEKMSPVSNSIEQ